MATLDVTVGGANSNSYGTVAEADIYFDSRIPLNPPWAQAADPEAALIMATRILEMLAQPIRTFVPGPPGDPGYYRVSRHWTGAAATSTQRLSWPRIGMFNRNGYPIAENVIPQELKEAQFELAGQLLAADRTLDNQVAVQGISSVKAGSVAISFRDAMTFKQVIPDAALALLIPSWLTEEIIESVGQFEFEVI